jgi:Tfp pilus assembly protein PilN
LSWIAPNLAHAPFENLRPLRRISLLLAILALLLTAWNVGTWLRTGAGAAEKGAELERLTLETEKRKAEIATLEAELTTLDLDAMNEQVEFLNERIADRAFSWNAFFEDLAEVIPSGVRIRQLAPSRQSGAERGSQRRARKTTSEVVEISLTAEAEDGEQELELIDRLFAHPRFESPDLSRDAVRPGGPHEFAFIVVYHPRITPEAEP